MGGIGIFQLLIVLIVFGGMGAVGLGLYLGLRNKK